MYACICKNSSLMGRWSLTTAVAEIRDFTLLVSQYDILVLLPFSMLLAEMAVKTSHHPRIVLEGSNFSATCDVLLKNPSIVLIGSPNWFAFRSQPLFTKEPRALDDGIIIRGPYLHLVSAHTRHTQLYQCLQHIGNVNFRDESPSLISKSIDVFVGDGERPSLCFDDAAVQRLISLSGDESDNGQAE